MSHSRFNILQQEKKMQNSIEQFEKAQFLCCFFQKTREQTPKDQIVNNRNLKQQQIFGKRPFQVEKNSEIGQVKTPSKLMFKKCMRQYKQNQENFDGKTTDRLNKQRFLSPNLNFTQKTLYSPSVSNTNSKHSRISQVQKTNQVLTSGTQLPLLKQCQSSTTLAYGNMKKKKSLTPLIRANANLTKNKQKKDLLCAKDLFTDQTKILIPKENINQNYQQNTIKFTNQKKIQQIGKNHVQSSLDQHQNLSKAFFMFPQIQKFPTKELYLMSFQDRNEQNLESKVIQKLNPSEMTFNRKDLLIVNKSANRINKLPISTANSQDVLNSFCKQSFQGIQNQGSKVNSDSIIVNNHFNLQMSKKKQFKNHSGKIFEHANLKRLNILQSIESPLQKTVKKESLDASSQILAFRQNTRTVNSVWGSYINHQIKVDQSLIVMDFFNPTIQEKYAIQNSQINIKQKRKEFEYKYFSDYIQKQFQ